MDKYIAKEGLRKITEDEIRKAAMIFDGTCPFSDKGGECSVMSVISCNRCKVTTGEGDIGSTGE